MDAETLRTLSNAVQTMDESEQAGYESFVASREKGKRKLVDLIRFLSTDETDPLVAREIEACKRLIERIDGRFAPKAAAGAPE